MVQRVISLLPHTHQSDVLEHVALFAVDLISMVIAQYICWPRQAGTQFHVLPVLFPLCALALS